MVRGRGGLVGLAALPVLAALLAGCAGSSPSAAGNATAVSHPPTHASVPPTTSPEPPTSVPSSTTVATVSACTYSELAVSGGRTGAGTGHAGGPVVFTNTGPTACSLFGYPGVAGLDAAGTQVVQATRTLSGYLGGLQTGTTPPPTVDLAPGGTASAYVETIDHPIGTPPYAPCPQYTELLVTPPTATQSVRVGMTLPACNGLDVHPVVAGTTGRPS